MNKSSPITLRAACASVDLPQGDVPEWVHLLPAANGEVRTHDGRGPYRVVNLAAIIAASMNADSRDAGGLVIDENHASDLAAPKGGPSPARGHIVEMQARPDGIWGRVAWGATGQALLAERAYRGLSPVIDYLPGGEIVRIQRASLVNYPNLRGLTALNSEVQMDLTALMAELGLAETATMPDILAQVATLKANGTASIELTALQASMGQIGALVGVAGGNAEAVLAGVQLAAGGKATLTALQAQVSAQAAQIAELTVGNQRKQSEAYIDGQIAAKRMGINAANRDQMVALHMSQPDTCKTLVEGFPIAAASHVGTAAPVMTGGVQTALNAEQAHAAKLLGVPADKYLATLNDERAKEEAR